jgi:hypothetical protein
MLLKGMETVIGGIFDRDELVAMIDEGKIPTLI